MEDWGEEWTGSLNKTNVFVHSQVEPTPPPASDLTAVDAAQLVNSSPIVQYPTDGQQQVSGGAKSPAAPQSYSAAANQTVVPAASLGSLVQGQTQAPPPLGGLAALLQQAAPQSMLSSSTSPATANGKVPHLQQQQQQPQPAILGGISTNVGDVIKASSQSGSGTPLFSSNASAAPAASISTNFSSPHMSSIFSTSKF